ncbi:MAG TPA: hypothetical protein P5521_05630, partial [Candidatus Omnitrophota bacterium]|nr:hypothetical protein [Candidatus Omnitrophota bacterium]
MFKRFVYVTLQLVLAVSLCGYPHTGTAATDGDVAVAKSLENAFAGVADRVGPSVVAISTMHTAKMRSPGGMGD